MWPVQFKKIPDLTQQGWRSARAQHSWRGTRLKNPWAKQSK
jgi:hypothetical protein